MGRLLFALVFQCARLDGRGLETSLNDVARRKSQWKARLDMRRLIVIIATIVRAIETLIRSTVASPRQSSRSRSSAVQSEIRQTKPFRSTAQEATIALLRTTSIVNRALARVVEPYGLSLAQYNALRIIRGAASGGIPTLSIRERMIEEGTTITRLLDKLEDAGLI